MKLGNSYTSAISQFIVIVLMSVSASYTYLNTQSNFEINGVCFYRYVAYGMTVLFSYGCVSRYNKHMAFLLSFALSALALSPFSREIVEGFPIFVSFFAILMGVTTVLLVPAARGRGFFEFLLVLILPAILAESRLGGFPHFIVSSQSITYYEVFVVTLLVVGGGFYLRFATWGNLVYRDLLSKGEREGEAKAVDWWTSFLSGIVIVGAVGVTVFLAVVAPVVAGVFQPLFKDQGFYALVLMGCIGIVAVVAIFAFQMSAKTKYAHS